MEERKDCRSFHRKLRDRMSVGERQEKSGVICGNLLSEPWFLDCELIYGYFPVKSEADCLTVLKNALSCGKRVALPKTGANGQMDFYEIRSLSETEEGRFHVREPKGNGSPLQNTEGIVLTPGLVFDRLGNRYGYGKGYYDRYFARFPKLKRFALAFENQMDMQIETNSTDIKMHRIYTEKCCYLFF